MERNTTFTEGKILQPLILFAMPVLFALFLQAMYGAVDLLVVGKFASSADVSAVSTGSQIMMTLTNLISSFAMGTTVLLGQQIGCGKKEEGGKAVGTAMVMFAGIALVMTVLLVCFAPQISSIMHAPKEAFDKTAAYIFSLYSISLIFPRTGRDFSFANVSFCSNHLLLFPFLRKLLKCLGCHT
jgi:Na+-driven multidrug efflux pump